MLLLVVAMTRLEVRQDGDATIVSVKVRGKDEAEFNQRLNEYLPESKVTVTRSGGYHPFGSDYTLKPDIKLVQKLGNYYRVPYELTFKAPTFSSLDQQKVNTLNYDFGACRCAVHRQWWRAERQE